MKQESIILHKRTNSSDKRCMKNKSWKLIVTKQEYSTHISEEYEYSYEKAEHVSLPDKNARIQFIQNTTKQKQKHTDVPSIVHKM